MTSPHPIPTTSGLAFRVTIMGPQQAEAYERVHAVVDSAHAVVHLFSHDGQTHYLTIPAGSALPVMYPTRRLSPGRSSRATTTA